MLRQNFKNKQIFFQYIFLIFIFSDCSLLIAASDKYPIKAYTAHELANVRKWEKKWTGTKISSNNAGQVKELLPDSFYSLIKNTTIWGESWFTIVPYKQIYPSSGNLSATNKYIGASKIGSKGEIVNWTAGVPFPNPKNGLQMAHNFRRRSFGDSIKTDEKGYIIDGRFKYDMQLRIKNQQYFFTGRTDAPPIPEVPNNNKNIRRAFSMLQLMPPETRNMRIIETQYKDQTKPYDSWFWMPSIRRIRRRSTSERQDALGGADFCGYDNLGWDGPVHINNYKYLGKREFLLARHTDRSKLKHTPGDCLWDGTQRERIKVHLLEVTNSEKHFLYSKMIWYLDPETWQILYSDRYDRHGRLWKVLDQLGFVSTGYNGVPVDYFTGNQMIDVQRTHSTIAIGDYNFGLQINHKIFSIQYLQKYGY